MVQDMETSVKTFDRRQACSASAGSVCFAVMAVRLRGGQIPIRSAERSLIKNNGGHFGRAISGQPIGCVGYGWYVVDNSLFLI